MTVLLTAAALMALATIWFVATAVRRVPQSAREDREGLVQVRDRLLAQLRELDVEEGDGNVDTNIAADERRRLEADLAQVLKSLESAEVGKGAPGAASSRQWLVAILALALILPLASGALYLGNHAPVLAQLEQASALARGEVPPMVRDMVARLERRLAEEPDDAQGWARLGRAYAVLGRDQEAQRVYARAYEIAPDDAEVVADYAAFLLSRDPTGLSPDALALFQKLHALDPEHPGALWALGLAAYQEDKFDTAVTFWERLLKQVPPESEVAPQVRRAIATARAAAEKAK